MDLLQHQKGSSTDLGADTIRDKETMHRLITKLSRADAAIYNGDDDGVTSTSTTAMKTLLGEGGGPRFERAPGTKKKKKKRTRGPGPKRAGLDPVSV
ncbi:DNA polymerase epsilon subunit 2 [Pyrus ussuriensis x Pyrus communis]|uniref:DNA polymerase epsilon subunit 2 n=1 Tax=Pyrus ussuriensis x Pyrus communis TaxID=2448454 RepID=A0A5N5G165_9ROSA|nr:DNA polymerase epsilon subunit 2 [Pyrus ussuriensis x Pyrus communis]